jgi:hypothetical protein
MFWVVLIGIAVGAWIISGKKKNVQEVDSIK